jgi:hypothetical protein
VIPPPGLDGSQYADGIKNEAIALSALSRDVKSINAFGYEGDVEAIQATTIQLMNWRIAVIQFAAAHGLTYAGWVKRVGTTE